MLASGAGALFLAERANWSFVYAAMSVLMLAGVLTTLFVGEPERGAALHETTAVGGAARASVAARLATWVEQAVVEPFADFMRRPRWLAILLFVALYKLGDALAGVMTNPFLVEVGFSKTEIATVVKTYGLAATSVRVWAVACSVRSG